MGPAQMLMNWGLFPTELAEEQLKSYVYSHEQHRKLLFFCVFITMQGVIKILSSDVFVLNILTFE